MKDEAKTNTQLRSNDKLSLTAFILFLVALFTPILCGLYQLSAILIYASCIADILAIVFGLFAWKNRLSKIAVVGAGLICLIGFVNLMRFYL